MPSILFIRISAIGDIVMASPIISAARQHYPNAHLAWLAQPECAALLNDHPDLDEVIIWPRKQWQDLWKQKRFKELWQEIKQFSAMLKAKQFDIAIDMQGLLKSGLLALLSGAKKRIGLGSREGSHLWMHEVVPRDKGDTQMIGSEYRYLAEHMGWPHQNLPMQIGISDASAENANHVIEKQINTENYAIICPFTTRPQKHWFNDYWQTLIEEIKSNTSLKIVMLGGPGDVAAAEAIAAESDIINLVGKTSLQEAAEIIRRGRCLIGVDTGLTHMGHAFKIPTIALFGSTCPYTKTDSAVSRVIYHDFPCAPCKRNPTCNGAFTCLRDITPIEVMKTLLPLLDSPQ